MALPAVVFFGLGAAYAYKSIKKKASKTTSDDLAAIKKLKKLAKEHGLDIAGGSVRRTSSRFCLGVEHGDYNGTPLFGVGTDRFIWMAYKPNGTDKIRMYSDNFPDDGVITFQSGKVPAPLSPQTSFTWARFPFGVDYILNKAKLKTTVGFDAVIYGNIPGGGMSRSASLTLNLILTVLEVNKQTVADDFDIVTMAQAVENVYIGSPCGLLDQIMIYYAKEGMGTFYDAANKSIKHIPFAEDSLFPWLQNDFRIVSLDTGTVRPGLDKSTYKIRRTECDTFAGMLGHPLADVKTPADYQKVLDKYQVSHPALCERLTYIYHAHERFYRLMEAWREGDIATIGNIFRLDGHGLRDEYKISGPELETMCDIVRCVPGVLGERMLGGGDKGAAGCIASSWAVPRIERMVAQAYPKCHPNYGDKFAVHSCKMVDGVLTFQGLL